MVYSIDDLLTQDGRSSFDREAAALICGHRHEAAEKLIAGLLAAARTHLADLCLTTPSEAVSIAGWDEFNTRIEALSASGEPVLAVGIDISDHGATVDLQGRPEQTLETSYYDKSSGFDFADRDALAAAAAGDTAAAWVGSFAELDDSLSSQGLAPVCQGLLDSPQRLWSSLVSDAQRRENVSAFLAAWFRHLRIHQAVKRGLETHALARNVPVIVGTNDVAPFFTAVYYPSRTTDYSAAAAELNEAKREANRAAYDRHTEEQIAVWRERREAIRGWDPRVNPDKLRLYTEFVEASEKVERMGTPLSNFAPGHALPAGEFERMIQAYRRHRNPDRVTPPPAPPGMPRRLFGFGRKGV